MRDNYICLFVGVVVLVFGCYVFYIAAATNDNGCGVIGFAILLFGISIVNVNLREILRMSGGSREGAGRPKGTIKPDSEKRKMGQITLLPHEWDQLDEIGPSRGKAVSKLLSPNNPKNTTHALK